MEKRKTEAEKRQWTRPKLEKIGTMRDVAGPIAGGPQSANNKT